MSNRPATLAEHCGYFRRLGRGPVGGGATTTTTAFLAEGSANGP
jgi:hypothetical protein